MSVSRVRPESLLAVWTQLVPQIRKGLQRGMGETFTESGLFKELACGDVDLWAIHRGSELIGGVFLEIRERPRGKVLFVRNVVAGNGQRRAWEACSAFMLKRLREYGEMIGAYSIEGHTRLGVARLLMRLGCTPKAMIMELRDGQRT